MNPTVSIYSESSGGHPGTVVHTLTTPASISDAPVTTFTAPSGATLAAGTTYYVVISTTSSGISLSRTNATAEDTGGVSGWSIADSRRFFGISGWNTTTTPIRMRVNGAPTAAVLDLQTSGWWAAPRRSMPGTTPAPRTPRPTMGVTETSPRRLEPGAQRPNGTAVGSRALGAASLVRRPVPAAVHLLGAPQRLCSSLSPQRSPPITPGSRTRPPTATPTSRTTARPSGPSAAPRTWTPGTTPAPPIPPATRAWPSTGWAATRSPTTMRTSTTRTGTKKRP